MGIRENGFFSSKSFTTERMGIRQNGYSTKWVFRVPENLIFEQNGKWNFAEHKIREIKKFDIWTSVRFPNRFFVFTEWVPPLGVTFALVWTLYCNISNTWKPTTTVRKTLTCLVFMRCLDCRIELKQNRKWLLRVRSHSGNANSRPGNFLELKYEMSRFQKLETRNFNFWSKNSNGDQFCFLLCYHSPDEPKQEEKQHFEHIWATSV